MNTQNTSNDGLADEIPQRAVSLYGQGDGVEDFPVLKAFQQYIDAEQEKARKRIIGLSIFFGGILVVVVAVFLFLLHNINVRNQSLSDRFMEYAMKEGERRQSAQPVAQPAAQSDAVLRSMTETLVALQKKIEDGETAKAAAVPATPAVDPKVLAEQEKLLREKAALEAEKRRLDEERERLRQIEIERQRRKLYPEFYEAQSPSRAKTRTLTDDDIREIIREAYPDAEDDAKPASTAKRNKAKEETSEPDPEPSADTPIEYFKDDEYSVPIDVKGSDRKINFSIGM